MNFNYLCFLDFETGGKNSKRTQPTQLSAVMIDARKLEIVDGAVFNAYIKPFFNEEDCVKYDLDPVEDEALEVTKIKKSTLEKAQSPKIVWNSFVSFVEQYNKKRDKWNAPIMCGYNSDRFDSNIVDRLCGGNNLFNDGVEPYKFGPWDDKGNQNKLFHPIHAIDAMKYVWYWFENEIDIKSLSFDSMRNHLGIDKDGAHNALVDVIQGAFMLTKFLKLARNLSTTIKFKNSFTKENKIIARMVEKYAKSN